MSCLTQKIQVGSCKAMSCPIESYELASPKLQGNLNLPAIFLHQTTNLFSTKPSTTSVKKHTFSTFAQFHSLPHSIFGHFQTKVIFLQKQPQKRHYDREITLKMYKNKQKQDNLSEKVINSRTRHTIRFTPKRSRKSTGETLRTSTKMSCRFPTKIKKQKQERS